MAVSEAEILRTAREIVARFNDTEYPSLAKRTREGRGDDDEEMLIAVEAVKVGIAMAGARRVRAGTIRAAVLSRLRQGPATNADLQNALDTHGADVARTLNGMMKLGLVRRIDGAAGRGLRAVYALPEPA